MAGGALMGLVAFGIGYERPFKHEMGTTNVAETFGIAKHAGNWGKLSSKRELNRVIEYNRFGIWKFVSNKRNIQNHIFVKMYGKYTQTIVMFGDYKYHQIRRHTGELCAAVRAERLHPRNSEKWAGWGL